VADSLLTEQVRDSGTAILLGSVSAGWSVIGSEATLSKLAPPATQKGLTYAKGIQP
jgi:hypothetical protein